MGIGPELKQQPEVDLINNIQDNKVNDKEDDVKIDVQDQIQNDKSKSNILGFQDTSKGVEDNISTYSDVVIDEDLQPDTKILTSIKKIIYEPVVVDLKTKSIDGNIVVDSADEELINKGVSPEDAVLSVNGNSTVGLTPEDVSLLINNSKDNLVNLEIIHENEITSVSIPVTQKIKNVSSVTNNVKDMFQEKIGDIVDDTIDSVSKTIGANKIIDDTEKVKSGFSVVFDYGKKVVDVFFWVINALSRVVGYVV